MIELPIPLKARVDALLAKLAVLSDAPTQKLDPTSPSVKRPASLKPGETLRGAGTAHRPHLASREPPGVREGRSNAFDPDRDSLFDWFVWRLGRADGIAQVRALCVEAEHRYERIKGTVGGPDRYTERSIYGVKVDAKERDRRIAEDYPGLSSYEVAGIETELEGPITAENVRRVRLTHRKGDDPRDPETGHPLPTEFKLSGDARKRRARELDDEGVPVRQIAERFRVSHTTVLGWLGRRGEKEAA